MKNSYHTGVMKNPPHTYVARRTLRTNTIECARHNGAIIMAAPAHHVNAIMLTLAHRVGATILALAHRISNVVFTLPLRVGALEIAHVHNQTSGL